MNRRCFRQHAKPAERIDLFVFLANAIGNGCAAHPVKPVASCNEITVYPHVATVLLEGHKRRVTIRIVDFDVLDVVFDFTFRLLTRLIEISRQFGLAINNNAGLRALFKIYPEMIVSICDYRSIMRKALAIQPLRHAGQTHEIHKSALKNACPDAPKHIFFGFAFQHDRVDALLVQKLGQQKPRWPRANDTDLSSHTESSCSLER